MWDGASATIPVYYVADMNIVAVCVNGQWATFFEALFGADMPISGLVNDIEEIESDGIWVILGAGGWKQYSLVS